MTYGDFKLLVSGFLIGDNALPKNNGKDNDEVVKQLLSYAYSIVAKKAESLRLMTLDKSGDIMRGSIGDYLTRRPTLPEDDYSELDIDEDLAFAAARYVAAAISKDKIAYHISDAENIILQYNGIVYSMLEKMNLNEDGNCEL
jgi:hypothetical protein